MVGVSKINLSSIVTADISIKISLMIKIDETASIVI